MKQFKRRIYEIIEFTGPPLSANWIFDFILIMMVLLNAFAIMIESVEKLYGEYLYAIYFFETLSVGFFAVEYLLRIWSITEKANYAHPIYGRLKFAITPMAIIDLLSFLPFILLPYIDHFEFVKFFSLLRFFRFLKIVRYIKAVKIFGNVLKNKKDELIFSLVFVFFMLLLVSTLMYYVEKDVQPDKFKSIPESMWWGVVTLTTLGYGDMYPITTMGKILGGIIAILGVGLLAIPSGIMAAGFTEEIQREKEIHHQKHFCPYCGNHLH